MMKEYEIIEGKTLREAIVECVKRKKVPLNYEQIWKLRGKNLIPQQWYSTSTLFIKGKPKTATLQDLKNIEEIYEEGGRLLFAYYDLIGFNGDYGLYSIARFVVEKSGGATKK